jgi:hypothetical protein
MITGKIVSQNGTPSQRLSVVRGESTVVILELYDTGTGLPVDLTGWSALDVGFIQPDGVSLINKTSASVPASNTYNDEVVLTAVTPGTAGNSIVFTFDGTSTTQNLVNSYNAANPSAEVVLSGVPGNIEPAGSVQLEGGLNANGGASIPSGVNTQMGQIQVNLAAIDTPVMRLGTLQTFSAIVTYSSGSVTEALFNNLLDVVEFP